MGDSKEMLENGNGVRRLRTVRKNQNGLNQSAAEQAIQDMEEEHEAMDRQAWPTIRKRVKTLLTSLVFVIAMVSISIAIIELLAAAFEYLGLP